MHSTPEKHERRFWPVRYAALVVSMCLMMVAIVIGQAPLTLSGSEQRSINETLDAFGTTLTKMDFDAFGALLTDDCDFVNIVGMHWVGKVRWRRDTALYSLPDIEAFPSTSSTRVRLCWRRG
jgi:hypothetical protein